MKEIKDKVLIRIALWLIKLHRGQVIGTSTLLAKNVNCKAYLLACDKFPDNTLKKNSEIAQHTKNILFDLSTLEEQELIREEVELLLHTLEADAETNKNISNYHRALANLYSTPPLSDEYKSVIEYHLKKAYKLNENNSKLEDKELYALKKESKKKLKNLQKSVQETNKAHIKNEAQKIIKPVKITSAHIIFCASIFSTVFLSSGFVYNKFLFSAFGINTVDFFSLSDYLASSIDSVFTALIYTALGFITYIFGATGKLNKIIHQEQYEHAPKQDKDHFISFFILFLSILLVRHSYINNEILYPVLILLVYIIFIYFLSGPAVLDMIENKIAVITSLFLALTFSSQLALKIATDINKIKDGSYQEPYSIKYTDEYSEYNSYKFISSNSSYIFLVTTQNPKKFVAIPKGAAISISTR